MVVNLKKKEYSKNIVFYLLVCFSFLFLINFSLAWADNGSAFQYIDGCGTLNVAGGVYELNASIVTTNAPTCLTIGQSGIVFNMSNYSIINTGGTGTNRMIYSVGKSNILVTSSWDWDWASKGISNDAGMIKTKVNNGATGYQRGMHFENGRNITIDKVYASCYDDPTHVTSNNEGLILINTTDTMVSNREWVQYFWRQQVWAPYANVTFENITWKHVDSATPATGIFFNHNGDTNRRVTAVINNFTALDGKGTGVASFSVNSTGSIIKNSLLNSSSYSILIGRSTKNISIFNNTIYGGISLSRGTIGTGVTDSNMLIENNTIVATGLNTVAFNLQGLGNNIIKNNNISSSYYDAISVSASSNTLGTFNNTFENNTLYSPSYIEGSAINLKNLDGRGTMPALNLGKNFTIAFTFENYNTTSGEDVRILRKDGNNYIFFTWAGQITFVVGGGSYGCVGGAGSSGVDRMVITKRDIDSHARIYANGVELSCTEWSSQLNKSFDGIIYLNSPSLGETNAMAGLDELVIYNTSKGYSWVLDDYRGGAIKKHDSSEDNIIHGWHFDEGTGANAENFVNPSNNITLSGTYEWNGTGYGVNRYDLVLGRGVNRQNYTIFKNQPISRYYINTSGAYTLNNTIIIMNDYGIINFTQGFNSSKGYIEGSNFSNDIKLESNFASSDESNNLSAPAIIDLYNIGTFLYPKIFRNNIVCDLTTSPSCISLNNLQTNAQFSVSAWSNYSVGEFIGAEPRTPANGSVLDRQNYTYLNGTIYCGASTCDVYLINATDINNNITLETFNSVSTGSNISKFLSNLPVGIGFDWFIRIFNGVSTVDSVIWTFYPNNEPAIKNVHATINETEVKFYWENEMNMEWVSLYLGNEWLELRSITSLFDSWSLLNVYPGRTYLFKWQTGDNLMSMSDMHNFSVRSYGWNLDDMSDYTYRRMIVINHTLLNSADLNNYSINLTLDENNFQWCTGTQWWDSCYPAFTHLNYTTLNDIRFTNDYDYNILPFNITYANIPGEGGQSTQTIPDENRTTGAINDKDKMNDGDWNTYSVPAPAGVYYFNYTIPAGAKTNSMFRMYDGEWFWDGQLPVECYGGTKLRFKSDIDYNTPFIKTYCQNNADNTWISIKNTTSAHFYETMMTWQYEAQLQITIVPEHYDDNTQSLIPGIDGDYDTKLWMYYGASGVSNNQSVLNYAGIIQDNYTIETEEVHILGVPVISNINDSLGRTETGTNISWDVDQETDNRVKYGTNPWLLESTYYSSTKQIPETFEHQYGNIAHRIKLRVYGDDYLSLVSVVCSNNSYSGMYAINSSTDGLPVELIIPDLNTEEYLDWTITYNENKTWDRNTQRPVFDLAGLTENTTYWYRVEAYGTRGNATSEIQSFTLGTPVTQPSSYIINYTEDRPNAQVTVCANVTDIVGFDSASVSFQYFNQTDISFKETSATVVASSQVSNGAVVCKTINNLFGENNTYRVKVVTIPTSTCQGSPSDSNCGNNFWSQYDCTNFESYNNQCFWNPNLVCEGYQGDYCYYSFWDAGSCNGASGCSWSPNEQCVGDMYSYCSNWNGDSGTCGTVNGCYWYETGGSCYDVDMNYLGYASSYSDCVSTYGGVNYDGYSGCSYTTECYYQDTNSCGSYGGCYVYDYGGCSNTINCNEQSLDNCGNYGGCYNSDYSTCNNVDAGLTCEAQTNAFGCVAIGGCSWSAGDFPITGFSESYTNLFDSKYEFFIGNPVEDEQMYLDRQYCPKASDGTANLSATCYEEKGYREGSQQEEDWAYIETNNTDADQLEVLKYISGTQKEGNIVMQSIANYTMSSSAYGFNYYNLVGLTDDFYTFKIWQNGIFQDTLVLDWVKPSLTHKIHQSRIDENAFVQFNGTPASITYQIMYMKTPGTYNTSSYQWCQQQPNGNLYDCMSVQYWGTFGMDASLTGTEYDRGQFFRGGITNGEPADSGLLQSSRTINSLSGQEEDLSLGVGDERFCYAFTVYYWDDSFIPTNNITNYYARYWREDQHWSQYLGINQASEIDQWNLFQWQFDDVSMTRDWKEVNGTTILTPSVVKTVDSSVFDSGFNQSLVIGYQEGFNMDVSKDKIYKSGIYFDGQWINQQIGLHQQGFVIFNLPSNITLQSMDSDSDGLSDYSELYTYYSNPFLDDTDEDSMPDGYEVPLGFDLNDWTNKSDCSNNLYEGCTYTGGLDDFTLNNSNAFSVTVHAPVQNALLLTSTGLCNGSSNNLLLNNGILNITLAPGEYCHVQNNYNIFVHSAQNNAILKFTNPDENTKNINLTIDKLYNVNTSFDVSSCSSIYQLRWTRYGFSQVLLDRSQYQCEEGFVTVPYVNFSKSLNHYDLAYDYSPQSYNQPSNPTNPTNTSGGSGGSGIINSSTTNVTQSFIVISSDKIDMERVELIYNSTWKYDIENVINLEIFNSTNYTDISKLSISSNNTNLSVNLITREDIGKYKVSLTIFNSSENIANIKITIIQNGKTIVKDIQLQMREPTFIENTSNKISETYKNVAQKVINFFIKNWALLVGIICVIILILVIGYFERMSRNQVNNPSILK